MFNGYIPFEPYTLSCEFSEQPIFWVSVRLYFLKIFQRELSMSKKSFNDAELKIFMGCTKQAISYSELTVVRLELFSQLLTSQEY